MSVGRWCPNPKCLQPLRNGQASCPKCMPEAKPAKKKAKKKPAKKKTE